ncbi:hypothetical protein [Enterobacter soli]|uniref:hypothetical protein n=1 Tax=Enterobacter soli TaxID=885040 RepID=UPI002F3E7B92
MDITIQSLDFIAQSFAMMDATTHAHSVDALTGNMPTEVREEFNTLYNKYLVELTHDKLPATDGGKRG